MSDIDWTECVGPGWRGLVLPLVEQCKIEEVPILQVKEKFGGLRFYTGPCSEKLQTMITEAEIASFKTCEDCGAPGERSSFRGWVRTVCPKHLVEAK